MFKRIPALLLTGVMTFSLAVPAFAATARRRGRHTDAGGRGPGAIRGFDQ